MIVDPSTRMPCDCRCSTSARVSVPASFRYWLFSPSRPIQTQEMPKPTICSIEYDRSTLAELNT